MIKLAHGDLLQSGAEAIINTVNCVGVMGKGIALQFKQEFPGNYEAYRRACDAGEVRLGEMFVFDTGSMINPRWIINFPTKGHWKAKSRIEDIASGLKDLKRVIETLGVRSIAVPPLGCGNGGLDWPDVEPMIRTALGDLDDVEVMLFPPSGAPKVDSMRVNTMRPNMSRGRALVLSLLGLYGAAGYRHSLLEIQKLTYFLQESGEDLKLGFHKHHYGPYAENLRHVLKAVEGHLIAGYADGGDAPDKPLTLVPGAVEDAKGYLDQHDISRARFERVTKLVEGFESPYGLELLATVHWVMSREGATQHEIVERQVYGWNARKQQFTPRQLAIAEARLRSHGWLSPEVASAH